MVLGKVIACLVGSLLFGIGFYNIHKKVQFLKNGVETAATIADYQFQLDGTWSYVYRYITFNGKKISSTDHIYFPVQYRKKKPIGSEVKILYDINNPMKIIRKELTGNDIGFFFMVIAGILFLALGIFIIK